MTAPSRSKTESPIDTFDFDPYPKRERARFVPGPIPPILPEEVELMKALQRKFDIAFPPLKSDGSDVLIVSWAEIERQYLDLCAPWDQETPHLLMQTTRSAARHESAEKTLRALFVMNNVRTNIDTPEPRWGTGESYPMP